MGGMAGVLAQAGSSMASGASAVGSAMGSAAAGAAQAGKEMLSNAWKEASGGITMNDNMGDAAYKAGKAIMSKEYSKSAPVQPVQVQEAQAPQIQAPDAKTELDRLMSNFT
jgi:hypothetical protein